MQFSIYTSPLYSMHGNGFTYRPLLLELCIYKPDPVEWSSKIRLYTQHPVSASFLSLVKENPG